MATPVAVAFLILMTNERHIGLRHSLSETQRIFTTSWWTGEPDTLPARRDRRRRNNFPFADAEANALHINPPAPGQRVAMRRHWLPSSFVRFLWFCVALVVGLMVYVIGEAYAELYLRTLPHGNLETVVYVYGWVATVHLLDAVTGWVLGMREGERVGSYPLSWVFKLYVLSEPDQPYPLFVFLFVLLSNLCNLAIPKNRHLIAGFCIARLDDVLVSTNTSSMTAILC